MCDTVPDGQNPNHTRRRRTVIEIVAMLIDFFRPTIGEVSWTPWVRAVLTVMVVVAIVVVGAIVMHAVLL